MQGALDLPDQSDKLLITWLLGHWPAEGRAQGDLVIALGVE